MSNTISIVMPVYNGADYINNAIKDLQAQSYKDFELIIVEDASTDDTLHLIQGYGDDRIRFVALKEHKGAGNARNEGIKKASGKYLLFLDSDDRFEYDLLESIFAEAEKNNADVVLYDAMYQDSLSGIEMPSDHVVRKDIIPRNKSFSYNDYPEELLALSFNVVWTKLYRRDLIINNHIVFEDRPYMNDVYFHHVALLNAKKICYLDRKLVRYQQNRKGNSSNNDNYSRFPAISVEVTDKVKEYIIDKGLDKRLLLGLLENELFRMKGLLEATSEENFDEMYHIFRDALMKEECLDELCKRTWADKALTEWAKMLVECDKADFLNHYFHEYRNKYWEREFEHSWYKRSSDMACKELDVLINNKHWLYDEDVLKAGERVIIYGAGEVGRDYVNQIKREGKVILAGWADKNYQDLDDKLGIESPEILKARSFDRVVIAIRNMDVAGKIKKDFSEYISPEKILLMTDMQKGMNDLCEDK